MIGLFVESRNTLGMFAIDLNDGLFVESRNTLGMFALYLNFRMLFSNARHFKIPFLSKRSISGLMALLVIPNPK